MSWFLLTSDALCIQLVVKHDDEGHQLSSQVDLGSITWSSAYKYSITNSICKMGLIIPISQVVKIDGHDVYKTLTKYLIPSLSSIVASALIVLVPTMFK